MSDAAAAPGSARASAGSRRSLEREAARERAWLAAAGIEGWLSPAQGEALFDHAARCSGRGAIVEIGSWKGRSTVWLAHGARAAGQRVFAIDPHVNSRENPAARTFDEFSANLRRAEVDDVVTPMVMSSEQAASVLTGGVELLFIDGDHSVGGAERDARIWLPRVVEGGVVLMHDVLTASYRGPRGVFRRRICWSDEFAFVRRVGSMGIATRVAHRSSTDAMWGTAAGWLLYLIDVKKAWKGMLKS